MACIGALRTCGATAPLNSGVRQLKAHEPSPAMVNVQKSPLTRIKRITIYGLALIGAFKVATLVLPYIFGNGSHSSAIGELYVRAVASPGGKFKAIVFTNAGGGAIAPFCFQRVSVAPAAIKDSDVERMPQHQVFSGVCDSFANHDASPRLQWKTDSSLQIEFPINATAISSSQVSLKKSDASNSVAVSFLAHE